MTPEPYWAIDSASLPFCVIYAAIFIPFGLIFFLRRDKEPIKSRYWALSLVQMTHGQLDLLIHAIGQPYIPCWLDQTRGLVLLTWALPYVTRGAALWYKYSIQQSYSNGGFPENVEPDFKQRVVMYIHKRQYLVSTKYQLIYLAICFFTLLVFGLLTSFLDDTPGNFPCYSASYFYGTVAEGFFIIVALPILFYLLYPINDAYFIKLEIYMVELAGFPAICLWMISYQLKWTGVFYVHFWTGIIELIFLFGSIVFPVVMSYFFSSRIKKLRPADTESQVSTASIEDELKGVLAHETLSLYFERYAADSWALENLIFYRKVSEYKILPVDKLPEAARMIYNNYLAVDSHYQVNIDMALREKTFEQIEAKTIGYDLFDESEKHALGLLRYSIFPLWKGTKDCQVAMNKAGIENFQELLVHRRKKLMSPEELQIQEGYLD